MIISAQAMYECIRPTFYIGPIIYFHIMSIDIYVLLPIRTAYCFTTMFPAFAGVGQLLSIITVSTFLGLQHLLQTSHTYLYLNDEHPPLGLLLQHLPLSSKSKSFSLCINHPSSIHAPTISIYSFTKHHSLVQFSPAKLYLTNVVSQSHHSSNIPFSYPFYQTLPFVQHSMPRSH